MLTKNLREKSNNLRIGITGSPATGKKTLGKILAERLGEEYVSINEFAIKNHFAKRKNNEYIINVSRLRGKIGTNGKIVAGHLLSYVVPEKDLDLVIVLRCSPLLLRNRYQSRRYSENKIRENIEAEMIGLISAECARVYGAKKIAEFDTSKLKPETIARRTLDIIKGRTKSSFGSIDWLCGSTADSLEFALRGKYNRFNTPKKITRFANPKARKSRYYSGQ